MTTDPDVVERWLVVDERRLPMVVFDTRLLADTHVGPAAMVAWLAVAWHTRMRQFPASVAASEVAAYGRFSERTARRALDDIERTGYVRSAPVSGRAPRYELRPPREFDLPAWPSPWRHEARDREEWISAPQVQGEHRWLVDVDVSMLSFVQLDTRLLADTQVDDVAVAVYAALSWHTRRVDQRAWPATATLGRYTNLGDKRIRRALTDLEEAGWVCSIERRGHATIRRLLDPPAGPDGVSPWTPATDAGVNDAGPRGSARFAGARDEATEGPLARGSRSSGDPPTPATDAGVLSTTPDTREGGPLTQMPGNYHPSTADPAFTPSGTSIGHRTGDRSRVDGPGFEPRDARGRPVSPGQRAATDRAVARALRLIPTWAPQVLEDHSLLEDFAAVVTRDVERHRDARQIDVDVVVDAARTAMTERTQQHQPQPQETMPDDEHPPARRHHGGDRPTR